MPTPVERSRTAVLAAGTAAAVLALVALMGRVVLSLLGMFGRLGGSPKLVMG